MDVTKVNFDLVTEEFIRLLETCDFYAVDQEMTGISVKGTVDNYGFGLEESYLAKKLAAERYLAFQLGIALFHKKADGSGWEARPFNFWLRNGGPNSEDVVFSMDASDFHVKNGLEFRKWFNEGIPFSDRAKEETERAKLFPSAPTEEELSSEETAWVKQMVEKVTGWTKDEEASKEPLVHEERHVSPLADVALFFALQDAGLNVKAEPPLDGGCPIHRRNATTFTSVSAEEYAELQAEANKRRQGILNSRIGFRVVWNALVASKKPHIGHNYFTDILFAMQIHDGPLAETLAEHQKRVSASFPHLLDTKVLLNTLPQSLTFESSALGPAFNESNKRVVALNGKELNVTLPLGFERYAAKAVKMAELCRSEAVAAHHAAYDAYMTGIVFLNLRELAGIEHEKRWRDHIAVFGSVFFWRTDSDTAPYANITPFHISFPKALRREDFEPLFYNAEQKEKAVAWRAEKKKAEEKKQRAPPLKIGFYLGWLSDTEAVLGIVPEQDSNTILELVATNRKALQDRLEAGEESTPEDPLPTAEVAKLIEEVAVTPFAQWKESTLAEASAKKQRVE